MNPYMLVITLIEVLFQNLDDSSSKTCFCGGLRLPKRRKRRSRNRRRRKRKRRKNRRRNKRKRSRNKSVTFVTLFSKASLQCVNLVLSMDKFT